MSAIPLNKHSFNTVISQTTDSVLPLFEAFRTQIAALSALIPTDQYFKYNGMWNFTIQSACFLAALWVYLKEERLVTTEEVEKMLGAKVDLKSDSPGFHISIEEYLHGLISLTSELTRLAVNSVTFSDFQRPLKIQKFVSDLHSGFQLLNLKNDTLRKRFDGLKYEVKRVEEIVYDISVRGLVPRVAADDVGAAAGEGKERSTVAINEPAVVGTPGSTSMDTGA
ncbi:hypothetical protein HDV05_002825 [Chytridiales sp. JEL 0842]|nr:hypothetical protein HDV05_002825 [Chytridiales sp. JEL 0842]